MPDLWLPSETRHAMWDPLAEQLVVVGWRPGPAGLSSLDASPTLRVTVDHAAPATLTELLVHAPRGRLAEDDVRMLVALLGEDAAEALLVMIAAGPSSRPTRLPHDGARPVSADADPWTAARARRFGRLVVAADVADDDDIPALAGAIARLEAGRLATEVGEPPLVAADVVEGLLRRALDEMRTALPDSTIDPSLRHDIHNLLASARGFLDLRGHLDDALERALSSVDRLLDDAPSWPRRSKLAFDEDAGFHAAAAPAAAPSAHVPRPVRAPGARERRASTADRARPERPVEVDGSAFAWLDEGGNVHVRGRISDEHSWARVFRRKGQLLLSLAPLRLGDGAGTDAVIVIPPGHGAADLIVDVTDEPAAVRPSEAAIAVQRAVRAGRTAARLTRLSDPRSDASWLECSQAWRQAGDAQRANLAARYATAPPGSRTGRGRDGGGIGPLLADDVADL